MIVQDERLNNERRRELDRLSIEEIEEIYGSPEVTTIYYGPGQNDVKIQHRDPRRKWYWKPGDGTPEIVAETPAIAQAIGRCVASRLFGRVSLGEAIRAEAIHPGVCGWCDYPKDLLLATLDHAAWQSRYVDHEFVQWWFQDPTKPGRAVEYRRYTLLPREGGRYDNPAWADFFSRPIEERQRLIEAARGQAEA